MSNSYPPRIQAFRNEIIDKLPRAPYSTASLKALRAMPTNDIILAFLTWRMRFIPAKPRVVRLWSGGVTPSQVQAAGSKLQSFLEKVVAGEDLTPHLSVLVKKKGVILPGASPRDRGKDIDIVLTRQGLHHFHIGIPGSGNPKGRSDTLVFAEVLKEEFRIVTIADHRVFTRGSAQQRDFFRICHSYMAKDVPSGQGFMPNPVMGSGHSMLVTMYANKCETEMLRLDPLLDDSTFIDNLYNAQPLVRDGKSVARPANSSLTWRTATIR